MNQGNLLAVNTAFEHLSICLSVDGVIHSNYASQCRKRNDRLIFHVIEELLENAELGLSDLDGFVVVNGPGSYTGLRIGMAAIKTLAQVQGKPLLVVNSLEILAATASTIVTASIPNGLSSGQQLDSDVSAEGLDVLLNCSRAELFHAPFKLIDHEWVQQGEIELVDLAAKGVDPKRFDGRPVLLHRIPSRNIAKYDQYFEAMTLHPKTLPIPDATPLLSMGRKRLAELGANLPDAQPLYIKREI